MWFIRRIYKLKAKGQHIIILSQFYLVRKSLQLRLPEDKSLVAGTLQWLNASLEALFVEVWTAYVNWGPICIPDWSTENSNHSERCRTEFCNTIWNVSGQALNDWPKQQLRHWFKCNCNNPTKDWIAMDCEWAPFEKQFLSRKHRHIKNKSVLFFHFLLKHHPRERAKQRSQEYCFAQHPT